MMERDIIILERYEIMIKIAKEIRNAYFSINSSEISISFLEKTKMTKVV